MTFVEIVQILNILSPVLLLIGFFMGVYFYKYLDPIYKGVSLYLLLMLCVDFSGRTLKVLYGNNLIVLLVFSLIELTFFLYFFYKFLFKSRHRLIIGLSTLAMLYILYEIVIYKVDAKQFQSYAKVADNFVVITLALAFFHERINIYKESKWDNFQLNAVILAFFSINLIFFLPLNFLINESTGLKFYFWLGNLVITLLFYSYLSYSIWKNGRIRR
jgi:hypothetical protein